MATIDMVSADGEQFTVGAGDIDGELMFWIDAPQETVTVTVADPQQFVEAVKAVFGDQEVVTQFDIRADMADLERVVIDNEDSFIKEFCTSTNVMALTDIRFSSTRIVFSYVHNSGQHFVDDTSWDLFNQWVEKMGKRKQVKDFVLQYMAAKMKQDDHQDQLFDAVSALSRGNAHDFESMAYEYYKFIEDTISVIIGKENNEWINWYLYDNKYGENGRHGGAVEIDGVPYDISTPEMLVDICMDADQFNQDFFRGKTK